MNMSEREIRQFLIASLNEEIELLSKNELEVLLIQLQITRTEDAVITKRTHHVPTEDFGHDDD